VVVVEWVVGDPDTEELLPPSVDSVVAGVVVVESPVADVVVASAADELLDV